jgi:hypothetical protein
MFVSKAGAHPRTEHLKGTSLGYAPALLASIRRGWTGKKDKHSSLLLTIVNYGRKKFSEINTKLHLKQEFFNSVGQM